MVALAGALAGAALFGAGVLAGTAIDDRDTAAPPAASEPSPGRAQGSAPAATDRREDAPPGGSRAEPVLSLDEELASGVAVAHEERLTRTAVTRYQKEQRPEVTGAYCGKRSRSRYRCWITERRPLPQDAPPEAREAIPEGATEEQVEYAVRVKGRCWSAAFALATEPRTMLRGCL
jgi:hypothetical protein